MVGGSEGCIHRRTRADYSIGEPVVAIGDRKDLLACFANGLSRRSNMVTNNLVNSLTNRTGIQRGGCFGRHRTCSIRRESRRNYMTAARAELSLDPPPARKNSNVTKVSQSRPTKQASNSSTEILQVSITGFPGRPLAPLTRVKSGGSKRAVSFTFSSVKLDRADFFLARLHRNLRRL